MSDNHSIPLLQKMRQHISNSLYSLCRRDVNKANTFPLPFNSLRTMADGKDGPYVIGAMFTAGYSEKAERLAASCEKFGLPYVIHEVPTVHRSISGRGTEDLSYTKPNFICHLLAVHKKPVLYLDADTEFVSQPELIDQLVRSGCDFAIYNWFADEHTDRFVPIELSLPDNELPIRNRFYRFAGGAPWYSNRQLAVPVALNSMEILLPREPCCRDGTEP